MIFTFIRLLFLLVHFLLAYQGTSRVGPDPNRRSSPLEYPNTLSQSHTGVATVPGETAVHDLASSWCSAYGSFDAERLAALESREMEVVDRFGGWHHPIGLEAREQFWKDGIYMTSRKDFHPECTVQHVRLIGSNAAIVQVTVSYDEGIALKGGDRIAPFSEIHTLFLAKAEGRWLISAQDVVQQFFGVRRKKYPPF